MKLATKDIDRFIARPAPGIRAVLVYGPDAGLVRERSDALMRTAVADLSDPFLVSELSAESVAKDPARLSDEAAAMALTGGRRAVRVRDCGDSIGDAVKSMLQGPPGDTLVVLQAGELGPRSALRRLMEAADHAAALPCYADDAGNLDRVVHDALAAEQLSVSAEASAFLVANLGSDRAITRSELAKLALYAKGSQRVELNDAMAVVGDSAALSLEDLCFAVTGGEMAALDRALERSLQEGQSEVGVLRAVSRHLLRLQLIVDRAGRGESLEYILKSLRPPVFFARQGQIRRQAQGWPPERIRRALDLVLAAELACKTTGMPEAAVCGRTLMQVAALARQPGRGGRPGRGGGR
ncbi:MAG: DNA polymerase III subunit delta [Alphaproteobacteria bacterium]|nr:DNA polymerase III subunit delta [Alphaproteobacteria bacterium]